MYFELVGDRFLNNRVKALILAGGAGSRFYPYTEIIPKPMIPVGKSEKPVLDLIVKWLRKQGILEYVFLVNYKWRYIYNYFEDGSSFNVRINYSLDDEQYRGTGGAILKTYRSGLVDSRGLIWYGDILAPLNVRDLIDYHVDKNADLTLVVTNKYKVPVGVVEADSDNKIIKMVEKPELNISATIGVGVIEEHVFRERIEDELGYSFDFMGEFVPWMINKGYRVYRYIYDGEWFDVGSFERYKKLDANSIAIFEEH